jgi:mitogen-activated protein kinase kinase
MTKLIPNVAARTVSWDDDVLEEISRLGVGSTVHKVKDKRTGKIMARKTITPPPPDEVQMKQLLRQLSIMSSIEHMNIVLFYGTYISSPCEVKALLEFCEGGSLEAVGKRIKELNARVGENIAARLAEGVHPPIRASSFIINGYHRSSKVSRILTQRRSSTAKLNLPTYCYRARV